MIYSGWKRPWRVEIKKTRPTTNSRVARSVLAIHEPPAALVALKLGVRPPSDLFERFLQLRSGNDDQIWDIARHYGGLGVFCEMDELPDTDEVATDAGICVEFCDLWRYFAGVFTALVRLSSDSSSKNINDHPAWRYIIEVPSPILPSVEAKLLQAESRPYDGPGWLDLIRVLMRFHQSRSRNFLLAGVNLLLNLAYPTPEIVSYKGGSLMLGLKCDSLLKYIVHELAATVSNSESIVLCYHCSAILRPTVGGGSEYHCAKRGKRNFCPACQEAGMPKRYASRAYRARNRTANWSA